MRKPAPEPDLGDHFAPLHQRLIAALREAIRWS